MQCWEELQSLWSDVFHNFKVQFIPVSLKEEQFRLKIVLGTTQSATQCVKWLTAERPSILLYCSVSIYRLNTIITQQQHWNICAPESDVTAGNRSASTRVGCCKRRTKDYISITPEGNIKLWFLCGVILFNWWKRWRKTQKLRERERRLCGRWQLI